MRVQIEPIDHLSDLKNLVFAAVQLSEPALKEVEKGTHDKEKKLVFEWDVVEREKRIRAARDILAALFAPPTSRKPDVLVFSEYSLPPQAYVAGKGIPFQELADEHRCIIIAGSYFDDDPDSDFFCNNLCPVYLPGRKEPVTICKAEPSERERAHASVVEQAKERSQAGLAACRCCARQHQRISVPRLPASVRAAGRRSTDGS